MKVCNQCKIEKEKEEFYDHPKSKDGKSGSCKECMKKISSERQRKLREDPDLLEKERKRGREKYHRLNYKDRPQLNRKPAKEYRNRYPEKHSAVMASQRIENLNGHNHHWSYNEEHWKDVIDIDHASHKKAHRFLVYDPERMMYRRSDTMELLDSKEKHLDWINFCIEQKED